MDLITLSVAPRELDGKGGARQTRRDGQIPAVIYGDGKDVAKISIDARNFVLLVIGKHGEHAIVQLEVDGQPDLNGPAILKDIQYHPVRGHVMHADFMRIDLERRIHTMVPVELTGRSPGVLEGGLMDHMIREIEVECLALDVPDSLIADIGDLDIGMSLHVSDFATPDNVTVVTSLERTVVAVHAPRVVVEEVAEEEVVEGEEEAAETTEGETTDEETSD